MKNCPRVDRAFKLRIPVKSFPFSFSKTRWVFTWLGPSPDNYVKLDYTSKSLSSTYVIPRLRFHDKLTHFPTYFCCNSSTWPNCFINIHQKQVDLSVSTILQPRVRIPRQNLCFLQFINELWCERDENKQKEAGIDPYKNQRLWVEKIDGNVMFEEPWTQEQLIHLLKPLFELNR